MAEDIVKKVRDLIKNEDYKNPLTDEQISEKLSIFRETVTNIRKELDIPSSRERKRKVVKKAIKLIKSKYPDINTANLTANLERQGFKVSRSYISSIINDSQVDNVNTELQKNVEIEEEIDIFSRLIGHEGSLSKNIKQGKASVLYPPFGLPTLIVGESGTGKTLFAECIYKYAVEKGVIDGSAPFISLNCADYGDNPQLLLSILYGHKKGSFTGADQDTEGIVERANNGILFLDEIHRLPPKGQEMLFSILDKGRFRRLGEVSNDRESNIYFIGATTENIDSSLLLTFRRRIPMIIELPSMKDRPIQEKAKLIRIFFQEEANRTNSKIFVNSKIMAAFAMKKYPGNIGQLKSEIQVTCANGYVEKINNGTNEINIGYNEMLYHNFFNENLDNSEEDISKFNMTFKDILFIPNITNKHDSVNVIKDTHYSPPEDIYKKVEEKYYELKKSDISSVEIEKTIWKFIMDNFNMMGVDPNNDLTSLDELKYLVSDKILLVLKSFMKKIKERYTNFSVNERIAICLAIHVNEAVKRTRFRQDIINPNIIHIKENLKEEFEIACNLAWDLEQEEKIKIPEGEIGFIAMYINKLLKVKNSKNRIQIIVITHGKVASETVNVVNKLMDVDFPIAIDMPLDVNPIKIFEKVIEISKTLDAHNGILFFVDMGSLLNIGEIVQKRTGIKTRTIDRVDIVSVLEAVRKVHIYEETLDDVYYNIINSKHTYHMIPVENSDKPPALITMCLTGHGVAIKIKEILLDSYPDTKIIPLSIFDDNLKYKIDNLKQQYSIPAIFGTINPCIEGINFIPFENDFTKDQRMFLDYVLKRKNYNNLKKILKEDFIILDLEYKTKQEVIEIMSKILFDKGFIKSNYIDSVFKREQMSSTCFRGNIAIPHGLPTFVNESSIVFVRLNRFIEWDENGTKVNLVCMPAVRSDDINIINDLFKILKQKNKIERLLKAQNCVEFINVLYEPS